MPDVVAPARFTKDNPFPAHLTDNRLLSKPGSAKETRHVVVNIAGSGLTYKAGDSLGVFSSNHREEVSAILAALDATGAEPVLLPRSTEPIRFDDALTEKLALARPTRKMLELLAAKTVSPDEGERLAVLLAPEGKDLCAGFLEAREFIDLLHEFPSARPTPQELVDHMRRLMPRLYSIASAPQRHPTEIHLTVAVVRYEMNQRPRIGVCSTFLAERAELGAATVPVFVSHSHFGPPADGATDVIMVGPGTGVAPFRAFMQERVARGATGQSWLFFGDQHRAVDFLYEDEWQEYLAKGQLTRLDTAFSRDQLIKVYVQDRMRENATELWRWISRGAHVYVCGDATRMAKDVDQALHDVIAEQGHMEIADAGEYVKQMKKDKRYQRDVY